LKACLVVVAVKREPKAWRKRVGQVYIVEAERLEGEEVKKKSIKMSRR
jgi:hypothetical protein